MSKSNKTLFSKRDGPGQSENIRSAEGDNADHFVNDTSRFIADVNKAFNGTYSKSKKKRSLSQHPTRFSHEVFTSQSAYDQSVESVITQIKSGAIKVRTPEN